MHVVPEGAGRYDHIHGDEDLREDPLLDEAEDARDRAEASVQNLLFTLDAFVKDHKSREHDEELCALCQMADNAITEAEEVRP